MEEEEKEEEEQDTPVEGGPSHIQQIGVYQIVEHPEYVPGDNGEGSHDGHTGAQDLEEHAALLDLGVGGFEWVG